MAKITIKNYKQYINKENLPIVEAELDEGENPVGIFQKIYDWQEDYDHVEWTKFKNWWFKCKTCGAYEEGWQCICYAR